MKIEKFLKYHLKVMLFVYNWWDKVKTFEIFKIHQKWQNMAVHNFHTIHTRKAYTQEISFFRKIEKILKYHLKVMMIIYNW